MIKMSKSTHYNGKDYREGDEYKSPDQKTEERWVKNGIAEKVNDKSHPELRQSSKKVGPEMPKETTK